MLNVSNTKIFKAFTGKVLFIFFGFTKVSVEKEGLFSLAFV